MRKLIQKVMFAINRSSLGNNEVSIISCKKWDTRSNKPCFFMWLKIVELSSFCQQKLENVILYNPFSIRWRENEKKILRDLYVRTLMKLYRFDIFIPCRLDIYLLSIYMIWYIVRIWNYFIHGMRRIQV